MDDFENTILRSNRDISRMNASGYVLSNSIKADKKIIENNKKTLSDYKIEKESAPKHDNIFDNFVDSIVGHDNAKSVDNVIDRTAEVVSDGVTKAYQTALNLPTYALIGVSAVIFYMIFKK